MNFQRKILSDPIIKWVFRTADKLNIEGYVVGGYVRDSILGKKSKDRDFVLKDSAEYIARKTAKRLNGTFVALKAERTYRVVLKDKATLDFSCLISSINNDLEQRDFTINSIAWSPQTGIIDPFDGIKDLKNLYIKAVKIENLLQDPLRIIRAYRFAAEFGFKIDNNTRKALRAYSDSIFKVAHERITEEFFKILNNINAIKWLEECNKDMVLKKILYIRGLHKNLRLLKEFDNFIKKQLLMSDRKEILRCLKEEISQGLNRLGLLRLSILLGDFNASSTSLRVSKKINNALKVFKKAKNILKDKDLDTETLYKIFTMSGECVKEISIYLSFLKDEDLRFLLKRAKEYLRIKKKVLLDGNDIQEILRIKPGRKVGIIMSVLKRKQFAGLLKTRSQAISWCRCNFT